MAEYLNLSAQQVRSAPVSFRYNEMPSLCLAMDYHVEACFKLKIQSFDLLIGQLTGWVMPRHWIRLYSLAILGCEGDQHILNQRVIDGLMQLGKKLDVPLVVMHHDDSAPMTHDLTHIGFDRFTAGSRVFYTLNLRQR